jgi:hypothetical protein
MSEFGLVVGEDSMNLIEVVYDFWSLLFLVGLLRRSAVLSRLRIEPVTSIGIHVVI